MSSPVLLSSPKLDALCELEGNSGRDSLEANRSQDSKIGSSSVMFNTPTSNYLDCSDSLVNDSFTRWWESNLGYEDWLGFCGCNAESGRVGPVAGYDVFDCPGHGRMYYPCLDRAEIGRNNPVFRYKSVYNSASRLIGVLESLEIDGEPALSRGKVVNIVPTCPRKVSEWLENSGVLCWSEYGKLLQKEFYNRLCAEYDVTFGADGNLHVWKDKDITRCHAHLDFDVLNFVESAGADGKKFLTEFFGDGGKKYVFWDATIKRLWCESLYAVFPSDLLVCDDGSPLRAPVVEAGCVVEAGNVDVWMQDIPFSRRGKLLHHVRYRRRRAIVDVWNWFGSGKKFESSDWGKEFADGLLTYSNRCCSFGVWRRLKRYSAGGVVVPEKRCVLCGEPMVKCGWVSELPDRYNVVRLVKSVPYVDPPPPPPNSLRMWMSGD
jgi:hypothetical protein